MRTPLLCSLVFLCGTQVARAQQWANYPDGSNFQQVRPQMQMAPPPYGPQMGVPQYGYNPYAYNPYNPAPRMQAPMQPPMQAPMYGYPPNNVAPGAAPGFSSVNGAAATQLPLPPRTFQADVQVDGAGAQPKAVPQGVYQPSAASPYMMHGPLLDTTGGGSCAGGDCEVKFHRECRECFWVNADYLAAFVRPGPLNTPLVTSGAANDPSPGALGQPGTAVLFGGNLDFNRYDGIHVGAGLFLGDGNRFSVEAQGFYLLGNSVNFSAAADANGNPIIARPILNAATGLEDRFLTSLPTFFTGTTTVLAGSELGSIEFNGRVHSYSGSGFHADALCGFRYMRFSESLRVRDQLTPLIPGTLTFNGAAVIPPDTEADEDSFKTVNDFYGIQLGGSLHWERRWFSVDAFSKIGVGATVERVQINGTTTLLSAANGNQVASGGILALPSNIGDRSRTVFGFVPEAGLNFNVEATKNIRLRFGYSFLFWNAVARPGAQIDRAVNPGQVPSDLTFGTVTGLVRPVFRFNDDYLWVQTFNLGVEFHY